MLKQNNIKFILGTTALLIFAIGGFLFYKSDAKIAINNSELKQFQPNESPIAPEFISPEEAPIFEYYKPSYLADGKIDTSNWETFSDKDSGFSVRAPKEKAEMGTTRDLQNIFLYNINNKNNLLMIRVIKKKTGSNIDSWISNYVTENPNEIINKTNILIASHDALQFDIGKYIQAKNNRVLFSRAIYFSPQVPPNDSEQVDSLDSPFHYFVIDAGDRYILANYWVTTNKGYLDVYNSILSSIEIFPPTKN